MRVQLASTATNAKTTDSDCKWLSREVVYLFDIPERLGETCHSFCTLSKHIYCL